jgi:alcohol dehydrogenase class IV
MGVGDTRRSEAENAQAAIDAVRRLTAAVGTDRSLRDIGCTEELLPTLVTDALEDEVMASTPRFPTGDEVKELLLAAL